MAIAKEMQALSAEELRTRAGQLRETLFNLRLKHRTGTLDSSADLSKTRKELARVLTLLAQKEREAAARPGA